MSKSNAAYWEKRSLQDSSRAYNFAEDQLRKLKREYRQSIKTIESELLKAKDYESERLTDLKAKIQKELDTLFEIEQKLTKDTLKNVYDDGYYHTIFNVQQSVGYGTGVIFIEPRTAERAIATAWSGRNYSERIWTHRKQLGKKVDQLITQGTILGHSNAKMAKQLSKDMRVSFSQAARLVRTETNYVYNQSTKDAYEAMGQETYIFLATLDLRTSDACQSLDGQKFKLSEAKAGVNYPPMHPNCRSTTIPDVEADANEVRLAKLNGEYYEVPATMSYNEWYKKHVEDPLGPEKARQMKKMVQNQSKDREQYAKYKELLGVTAPKSFGEFQTMKYNKGNEWDVLNRQYKTFQKIEKGNYTDTYKRKLKATYRFFDKEGYELRKHALSRTIGQKQSKGKVQFTRDDILQMLKKSPNYEQKDGNLLRFENGILIVQASDTNEIISIVTRNKPNDDWKKV